MRHFDGKIILYSSGVFGIETVVNVKENEDEEKTVTVSNNHVFFLLSIDVKNEKKATLCVTELIQKLYFYLPFPSFCIVFTIPTRWIIRFMQLYIGHCHFYFLLLFYREKTQFSLLILQTLI